MQSSFSKLEYAVKKRLMWRDRFLAGIEAVTHGPTWLQRWSRCIQCVKNVELKWNKFRFSWLSYEPTAGIFFQADCAAFMRRRSSLVV
jgi:hypothetical protein